MVSRGLLISMTFRPIMTVSNATPTSRPYKVR